MLRGKHALITGASGGVGVIAARTLAEAGASLTLLGRSSEALTTVAARLVTEIDADILTVVCDLTRPDMVEAALDHALSTMGPCDIFIHTARPPTGDTNGPFLSMSPERYQLSCQLSWQIRVEAALQILQRIGPDMQKRPWARAMIIGSLHGIQGSPRDSAEGIADHALVGLVRHLAAEWVQTPITTHYLALGQVATEALLTEIDGLATRNRHSAQAIQAELARANPQGMLIEPAAIGRMLLWLCDPASQSFTGQISVLGAGALLSPS